jgi:hypothetical protein
LANPKKFIGQKFEDIYAFSNKTSQYDQTLNVFAIKKNPSMEHIMPTLLSIVSPTI